MNVKSFDSSKHQVALKSFVAQLQKDPNILAAFVYGSLVQNEIWEESDIDMLIVTKDDSLPYQQHWLKDGDIMIQIDVHSRRNFRDWMDVPLQGSILHHIIATGRLLFSNDATITEYHTDSSSFGSRDKNLGMMVYANSSLGYLSKIRKSITHKKNSLLAFRWIHGMMEQLAHLEVLSKGDVPAREVILQARTHHPEIFGKCYTDILENGVSLDACQESYNLSYVYLQEIAESVFEPIVTYILDQGGHCGISQIDKHFRRKLNQNDFFTLINACEFLVELGLIQRMAYPLKLTSKSRHEVYEAGYIHMEGELL